MFVCVLREKERARARRERERERGEGGVLLTIKRERSFSDNQEVTEGRW